MSARISPYSEQLKGEASQREALKFADEVMDTLQELYDTRLLEREFLHTHELAIVAHWVSMFLIRKKWVSVFVCFGAARKSLLIALVRVLVQNHSKLIFFEYDFLQ